MPSYAHCINLVAVVGGVIAELGLYAMSTSYPLWHIPTVLMRCEHNVKVFIYLLDI